MSKRFQKKPQIKAQIDVVPTVDQNKINSSLLLEENLNDVKSVDTEAVNSTSPSYKRGNISKSNTVVGPVKTKRKLLPVDTKIGLLTIKSPLGVNNRGDIVYSCVCECGNECLVSKNLLKKHKNSCGCLNLNHLTDCRQIRARPAYDKFIDEIFYRYQRNASKRDYKFELNKEDFEKLVLSNCKYCNLGPSNHSKRGKYYDFYYNGIDRLNNELGYTKDNTVSCCKKCNFFKGSLTADEFINHVKRIYEFINEKK